MTRAFADYPFTAARHPARLPAGMLAGVEQRRHPVVVVGGGPVGLCAALGLARHGVPVVLIEADDSVCIGSRAICISRRSLEILQRLGALEGFLAHGLPWTGGRSYYRDTEVLHFAMPQDHNQKLPPMINLPQYRIEQILVDAAQAHGERVDIRWATRVTSVSVTGDGVRLALATAQGDYQLDADWLVAADGGRGFIRRALGLSMHGTRYEGRYVIVDIRMASQRPTERLAYFDPPCNPGSTVLVHKQPGDVWRIDYQLRDGEDPEAAVRPENVVPRVESLLAMMGETAPWQPIWIGIYTANALTLERYRHGRVLFAGDAAHLLPIFGVRGANSGIDDADNLAWKLAFVVNGLGHERLLDSYSDERVAAAQENLRQGGKSTEFMAPPSFAFELMRKAVLSLAARHPGLRSLINPRQTSAIRYDASPLNQAGEPGERFAAGPPPGAVLPECPVMRDDGSRGYVTDLLGPGFTALGFGESSHMTAEISVLAERLAARGVPCSAVLLADIGEPLGALYDAAPGTVYLVRPDGHVLGRWRKADARRLEAAIDSALAGAPAVEKP